jgi:hypothetical protein
MYFPYDPWKSVPKSEYVPWVTPLGNPPEMEALEMWMAATERKNILLDAIVARRWYSKNQASRECLIPSSIVVNVAP